MEGRGCVEGATLKGGLRHLYQLTSPRFIHPPKTVLTPKPKTRRLQPDAAHTLPGVSVPGIQLYTGPAPHGGRFA